MKKLILILLFLAGCQEVTGDSAIACQKVCGPHKGVWIIKVDGTNGSGVFECWCRNGITIIVPLDKIKLFLPAEKE